MIIDTDPEPALEPEWTICVECGEAFELYPLSDPETCGPCLAGDPEEED